jgi:hypothetical protein
MFDEQPMPYVRRMGVEKTEGFPKKMARKEKNPPLEKPSIKHPAKMC